MAARKKGRLEKLYKILRELDCELQMLGVRSDWGIDSMPDFAAETLTCCLALLATEPGASNDYLESAAQELLDTSINRETGGFNGFTTFAELDAADKANDVLFGKVLKDYRAGFQNPRLENAKTRHEEEGASVLAAEGR
jgi:hypothetical protein